jgi:TetR/AcrR family transcriptional regulator, ethionamide resistance regulator
VSTRAQKLESRRALRRGSIAARLLESVESLLNEGRAFNDLTLEEIIERSDVPRSTFYYNFREKAELLVALSQDAVREIVEASLDLYRVGPDGTREEFNRQVRKTIDTWAPHVPLMNALAELASVNPRAKEQFIAGWAAAQRGVADHIREGQVNGTVRPELHPEHHAAWLTWMAERGIAQLIYPAEPQAREALSASLADIVWTVLYSK